MALIGKHILEHPNPRSGNQNPEIKIQKSRSGNQDPEIKIRKSRSGNQDPEIKIQKSRSGNQGDLRNSSPECEENFQAGCLHEQHPL